MERITTIRKWKTKCRRMKWTGNDLGAEGAKKISKFLMINTTLTTLLMSGYDNKWDKD